MYRPVPIIGVTLAIAVYAGDRSPSKDYNRIGVPVAYPAGDAIARNPAAEQRRDYAVLEAALNDLTSPWNPEYKYQIKNLGLARQIVLDSRTFNGRYGPLDLDQLSESIDHKECRLIPADLRADAIRRNQSPVRSLADFRPANPNVLVRDLESEFKDSENFVSDFVDRYPHAWGWVIAYLPGYSNNGHSALLVFEGGPNGIHGLDWTYVLRRKRNRWEVEWRHLHGHE